jgi:hypothetical protein
MRVRRAAAAATSCPSQPSTATAYSSSVSTAAGDGGAQHIAGCCQLSAVLVQAADQRTGTGLCISSEYVQVVATAATLRTPLTTPVSGGIRGIIRCRKIIRPGARARDLGSLAENRTVYSRKNSWYKTQISSF